MDRIEARCRCFPELFASLALWTDGRLETGQSFGEKGWKGGDSEWWWGGRDHTIWVDPPMNGPTFAASYWFYLLINQFQRNISLVRPKLRSPCQLAGLRRTFLQGNSYALQLLVMVHSFFFIRTTFFKPRLSVLKKIVIFSFRCS